MRSKWALCALLLASMACGQTALAARSKSAGPLSETQIMGLVAGSVASARISALVRKRGISFQPSEQFLSDLGRAGVRRL